MSGISRLLRWAPCFWAVCRIANSSNQAQRSHLITTQSGPQHPAGPSDLLQTLSFPARIVVKHPHVVRPTLASRPSSPHHVEESTSPATGRRGLRAVPDFLRHRHPQRHAGWSWEHPPCWPVRQVIQLVQSSSRIINQLRWTVTGRSVPVELRIGILLSLVRLAHAGGGGVDVNVRLVRRDWDTLLRRYYWKFKWLNLRPSVASWESIRERFQALISNADSIKKVKLGAGLTDIHPISPEKAIQRCPELAKLGLCHVDQVTVGRLDNLNEILLIHLLRHYQSKIRHFVFQAEDTVLFLGRRSIFVGSKLRLPNVKRITVDISNSVQDLLQEDSFDSTVEHISEFVAALIGEGRCNRPTRKIELRLRVLQSLEEAAPWPQIETPHILLATRVFDLVRALLEDGKAAIVASFEAPLSVQLRHNRNVIWIWARENQVKLINASQQ